MNFKKDDLNGLVQIRTVPTSTGPAEPAVQLID